MARDGAKASHTGAANPLTCEVSDGVLNSSSGSSASCSIWCMRNITLSPKVCSTSMGPLQHGHHPSSRGFMLSWVPSHVSIHVVW